MPEQASAFDATFDTTTACGRLRTPWNATADPQLAMSDDEVADVETVLQEHAAMTATLAGLSTKPLWQYRAFGPNNEIVFDPGVGERWSMVQLGGWRIERQPVYRGPWEPAPDLRKGDDDA